MAHEPVTVKQEDFKYNGMRYYLECPKCGRRSSGGPDKRHVPLNFVCKGEDKPFGGIVG